MNQRSYVHIRLRRDTAQNWTNNNPILKIGEPGLETDTRKLKFGDGTTAWNNLPYSGVDVNDNLLLENIDDRVANLIKAGSNISVNYNDSSNELIISATGLQLSGDYATLVNGKIPAIQLPSYVDDVLEFNNLASFPFSGEGDKIYVTKDSNKTYRWSGSAYVEISASPGSTDAVPEGSVNKYYTDSRASAAAPVQSVSGKTGTVTLTKSDVGLGNVDNTSDANKPVSTAQQTALDLKAPIANPTFTGTVNGITKGMVGLGNVDNTSDANKPVSTAQASADTAVQNAASTDATTKANNAQAFAIQRSNHTGTQDIGTISGLQSALDGKSATGHTHDDRYYTESEVDNLLATKQSSGTYATLVNGTVPAAQLPSYVDDVIEAANFSALPATGESGKIYVTLDSNKTYRWSGNAYIEISASPGSTDAVPEGSINKYYTDSRASAASPVQSVAGKTGVVTLTKNDVGLGNVDNTSDANKPVSTAQQTALDLKAPIANPTFTGTVNGITKGMVGLGNVDNTSDANKPVSTAQASADSAVQTAAAADATSKANAAQAAAVQRASRLGRNPYYYIPTANEWYKAAYYSPALNSGAGGYYTYATQSNTAPGTTPGSGANQANYLNANGGLLDVGSFTNSASYYGTFDQSGNAWEWNDLTGAASSSRGLRGGYWDNYAFSLSSSSRLTFDPSSEFDIIGFRLASPLNPLSLSNFVTVGNPGNANDSTGYGGVGYTYQIAKYELTNTEYCEFLNAVAATDTYGLFISSMAITRSGSSGSYTYAPSSDNGNKPVIYITWFRAARYCNWLTNGKPSGSQTVFTTEDGAYTLNGATSGNAPARNAPVTSVAGSTGDVTLTKADVGLGNVDNTSDANKPVSTAQASADTAVQNAASTDATTKANNAQAFAIQRSNHTGTQDIGTISGLQSALDGKSPINSPILSLGILSGINAINFGSDRLFQTLTLNGSAVTFTKGTGWPVISTAADVILRITVTSATSITWTVVNDWFSQPPAGALSIGTHLFLLRAIGSSIIEGHYIGSKTN